jgi:hypothetical protein
MLFVIFVAFFSTQNHLAVLTGRLEALANCTDEVYIPSNR